MTQLKGQMSLFDEQEYEKVIYIDGRKWYECNLIESANDKYKIFNPVIGEIIVDKIFTDDEKAMKQIFKNIRNERRLNIENN